jgi:hypothetical protein
MDVELIRSEGNSVDLFTTILKGEAYEYHSSKLSMIDYVKEKENQRN